MKLFLILTCSLLAAALGAVVIVYWLVMMQMNSESAPGAQFPVTDTTSVLEQPSATSSTTIEAVSVAIPPAGIPLSDVPLSSTQKRVIATVGIDIETFEFTPAMLSCGEEKLGSERIAAIIAGDAPTIVEVARLTPCISEKP